MHRLLSLLVAYRDTKCFESQRILRDQFHWLARFVFSIGFNKIRIYLGSFGNGLDCSGAFCEPSGSFRNSLACFGSVLEGLGSGLGASESVQEHINVWERFGSVWEHSGTV